MAWIILLTPGFTRLRPTIFTKAISLALLGIAMRTLPLATAYPTWTGINGLKLTTPN
jgi:quaternary ammonium compound-resistance protein SugE